MSPITISFVVFFLFVLYMKHFDFEKYCTPAQLYLILATISLVSEFLKDFRVSTLIVNAVFVLIYGWFLNFLCSKKLGFISWALVLAPFILFAAVFFLALDAMDLHEKEGLMV